MIFPKIVSVIHATPERAETERPVRVYSQIVGQSAPIATGTCADAARLFEYSVHEYRRVTGLVQILLALQANEGREPRLEGGAHCGVSPQSAHARAPACVHVEVGGQLQYCGPPDHNFRGPRRRHRGSAEHFRPAGRGVCNLHRMRCMRPVHHRIRVFLPGPSASLTASPETRYPGSTTNKTEKSNQSRATRPRG